MMELKAGYKQTEVGVIPEDWEVLPLKEVIKLPIQNGIFNNPIMKGSGFKLINVINLYQSSPIDTAQLEYLNASKVEIDKFKVNHGDIFFTRSSITADGIAQCNIYKKEKDEIILFDCHIIRVRLNSEKINPFYFFRYCQAFAARKYLVSNSKTTTMTTIDQSVIKKLPVLIPATQAEQTAIAAVLNDTDQLITQLEQLIAKKRNIKQGAIQTLLTGKKRLAGFKDEWCLSELPQVCWFQEGPGLRNWQFTKSGVKVINVTNLENGYLNLDKTDRYISNEELMRMYQHFKIDENDIVVASSGNSYAKVAVVRSHDLPLVMNTSVIRFKPFKNINYNFLLAFLKSNLFKDQIDLLITGGAQPNFGPAHLKKILVKMPSDINEQKEISDILANMDIEIHEIEKKLEKYRMLKQGMMQTLLTGKTRLVKLNSN